MSIALAAVDGALGVGENRGLIEGRVGDAGRGLAGSQGLDAGRGLGEGLGSFGLRPEPASGSFGNLLGELVERAATLGNTAEQRGDLLAQGRLDDVHGTLVSAKEAEISLKLVGSVRNRLLDSFHELWRMNV